MVDKIRYGKQFRWRSFCKLLIVLFSMVIYSPVQAQEMLGIVNSNYSGITGSMINPANTVCSPLYLDVNWFALDLFVENNYVYLAKSEYRFRRFISSNSVFPTHGVNNNLITYDYYTHSDKNAYANVRLIAPSFSINVGRHSFGLVTGARTVMSTRNMPFDIAKFGYESLLYPPQYDINYVNNRNVYNAELAWAEIGFNYSYVFKQQAQDYWAVGITVKDLLGFGGGYLYAKDIDYVMLDKDTLIVHNLNGEAGYSLPVNYQSNTFDANPLFKGKGIGVDIGVVYEKKQKSSPADNFDKLCAQNYVPYKYKIGVSLLDIGRIKFKQNAQKFTFDNASTYWPGVANTSFTSLENFSALLSNQFYGDSTKLISGNQIKVALPTALSVQVDYNYRDNWFLNGTMVYPVQFSKSGLIRPFVIAVSPRYETTVFEASLPLSIYDWSKPRIGVSARYRGFFMGTEKLGAYFHFTDFTGIDFYMGLKLSLRKGNCKGKPATSCGYDEYKGFVKTEKEKKPKKLRKALRLFE